VPWIEDGNRRHDRALSGGKIKQVPAAIEAEWTWAQNEETTGTALLEALVASAKGQWRLGSERGTLEIQEDFAVGKKAQVRAL
jgi:hypothetical protein